MLTDLINKLLFKITNKKVNQKNMKIATKRGGHNRKLTYDDAKEIRRLSEIAEMFGVSRQIIYGIQKDKQYIKRGDNK
jgi:hypothetical protein